MVGAGGSNGRVGMRVAMVVLWTALFLIGIAVGLLASFPGLGDAISRFSSATWESRTAAVAAAVALILMGLWGITAANRNLRHSLNLISEVDRARKETIALDNTRYLHPK